MRLKGTVSGERWRKATVYIAAYIMEPLKKGKEKALSCVRITRLWTPF